MLTPTIVTFVLGITVRDLVMTQAIEAELLLTEHCFGSFITSHTEGECGPLQNGHCSLPLAPPIDLLVAAA